MDYWTRLILIFLFVLKHTDYNLVRKVIKDVVKHREDVEVRLLLFFFLSFIANILMCNNSYYFVYIFSIDELLVV